MFLTELKEKLDGLQTERGNIPLSMARIMHEHTVLVSHSDPAFDDEDDDPPAEANGPKPTLIAEAEGVAGTLEERLEKAGIVGVISVTGEELAQLLEYRDELRASYQTKAEVGKGPELVTDLKTAETQLGETMAKVDQAKRAELQEARRAAQQQGAAGVADLEGKGKEVRMPCPQFDENKVACVLAFGHDGDHDFDPAHAPEVAKG